MSPSAAEATLNPLISYSFAAWEPQMDHEQQIRAMSVSGQSASDPQRFPIPARIVSRCPAPETKIVNQLHDVSALLEPPMLPYLFRRRNAPQNRMEKLRVH